ncbi:MAG: hypothetical protein GY719_14775 [bacterium]|nr:hypothetical protein [bacterium]
MADVWKMTLEDLAEILVYRAISKDKAHQLVSEAPPPFEFILWRDCSAYYEMYKMI